MWYQSSAHFHPSCPTPHTLACARSWFHTFICSGDQPGHERAVGIVLTDPYSPTWIPKGSDNLALSNSFLLTLLDQLPKWLNIICWTIYLTNLSHQSSNTLSVNICLHYSTSCIYPKSWGYKEAIHPIKSAAYSLVANSQKAWTPFYITWPKCSCSMYSVGSYSVRSTHEKPWLAWIHTHFKGRTEPGEGNVSCFGGNLSIRKFLIIFTSVTIY